MSPEDNPFSPGAGAPPPKLTGRDDLVARADTALKRAAAGRSHRGIVLLGLRGVGKTVLLNRIEDLAEEKNFFTIPIEAPEKKGLPETLVPKLFIALRKLSNVEAAKELTRKAFRGLATFAKGFKVDIGGVEASFDLGDGLFVSNDLEAELPELFLSIGRAAKAAGRPLVLLLDEIQYLSKGDLSALIVALHRVSQKQLPVAFFGGGLPQVAGLAGEAKSYAERLFSYEQIGQLSDEAADDALTQAVEGSAISFSPDALRAVREATKNYPYFLQEWGKHCWDLSPPGVVGEVLVSQASELAQKSLDAGFFNVRYDRMTPGERAYVHAMARLGAGPHSAADVAGAMGSTTGKKGSTKNSLVKKGMVYSPQHGLSAFTVPLFDEFVLRHHGEEPIPGP